MNEKALHILEFNKITEILSSFAGSEPAKRMCLNLRPSGNPEWIDHAQDETSAALSRLFKSDRLSFGANIDVRPFIKAASIGRTLGAGDLLAIARLLVNVKEVRDYHTETPTDCLDKYFLALDPLTNVSDKINKCIISDDEISDDASPTLREIRRNIKISTDRIQTGLTKMVNETLRGYLQDAIITTRNGRYCIPVKSEYRSHVPGMIHDRSQSGATLFIEPSSIVDLNNRLKELSSAEHDEVERILSELSAMCAANGDMIAEDQKTITMLDFIFAKAKYAMKINAVRPLYNKELRIVLRGARHPLLDPRTAVPVDIRLGDDFDLLIITGPNTGGKTVSLKTAGLLTLMGQAGLHIPALDRSELSVFSEVYADIGDEQSIEQSLSTFSSHMRSIVEIMKHAKQDSLCLFDELGAGTDPEEGAALAISILDTLHRQKIRSMATTHYSELKVYALQTEGVENAGCEFDIATLSPTYRLMIGIPGKSNAFAISKRLGLSDEIIEKAGQYISREEENFENVISDLEDRRNIIDKEKQEIENLKADILRREKILADKEEKIQEKKDRIIANAREEARDLLQDAKDKADETIRAFNKQGSVMKPATMEKKRRELREWISKEDEAIYQEAIKRSGKNKTPIKEKKKTELLTEKNALPGTPVFILSMDMDGVIAEAPDKKGNVLVQSGGISIKVKLSDLEMGDAPMPEKTVKKVRLDLSRATNISPEINVIGRTVDDAVSVIDKYLDDAYMSKLESVRIIHGKGTGALRSGIHDYLRTSPVVGSFSDAAHGEGDAGVTVVRFK
ncbi:MAG: endonuclease MutS2 [Lachnospiraceae bacterium]|nr:endonuclease MutS2 [Lachnospiraceae bacterium]